MAPTTDRKHIHTTVSSKTYKMIETLAVKYGTKQNVIEEAVKQLQIKNHNLDQLRKQDLDTFQLWDLMRDDFKMMAVARRTFLSYIAEIPDEPIKNNNALELIEWYYDNTNISDLSLFQILVGIKNLWLAGNYFRKVDIKSPAKLEPLKAKEFQMIFSHDFDDVRYGKYWAQYFKFVLEQSPIEVKVDFQTRHQSFYLDVKKI